MTDPVIVGSGNSGARCLLRKATFRWRLRPALSTVAAVFGESSARSRVGTADSTNRIPNPPTSGLGGGDRESNRRQAPSLRTFGPAPALPPRLWTTLTLLLHSARAANTSSPRIGGAIPSRIRGAYPDDRGEVAFVAPRPDDCLLVCECAGMLSVAGWFNLMNQRCLRTLPMRPGLPKRRYREEQFFSSVEFGLPLRHAPALLSRNPRTDAACLSDVEATESPRPPRVRKDDIDAGAIREARQVGFGVVAGEIQVVGHDAVPPRRDD